MDDGIAIQMLALSDESLSAQLIRMKEQMNEEVIEKDRKLQLEL